MEEDVKLRQPQPGPVQTTPGQNQAARTGATGRSSGKASQTRPGRPTTPSLLMRRSQRLNQPSYFPRTTQSSSIHANALKAARASMYGPLGRKKKKNTTGAVRAGRARGGGSRVGKKANRAIVPTMARAVATPFRGLYFRSK